MRRQTLALATLAVVLLAACSSDDDSSSPSTTAPLIEAPTTTVALTPVVAKVVTPEAGSVQAGRGMVVVLSFTAVDPAALPAQFRLGGDLPAPATPAKPGRNPAFPGLVVGTTITPASLGGPSANLANLFQIVSPSRQPDGSMQVTAVWTNAQASLGSDIDVTVGALTVSGAAPDVIPQPLTEMSLNSNVASVTFRLSAAEAAAVSGAATTTTTSSSSRATTTTRRSTTTTRPSTTTTTAAGSTTSTTRAATTTTVPVTTSTTRLLGLF